MLAVGKSNSDEDKTKCFDGPKSSFGEHIIMNKCKWYM